jgi:hypothetical protein
VKSAERCTFCRSRSLHGGFFLHRVAISGLTAGCAAPRNGGRTNGIIAFGLLVPSNLHLRQIIMLDQYRSHAQQIIAKIRGDGFYKTERVIQSPQSSAIHLVEGRDVLNFCANNYLASPMIHV